MLCCIAQIWLQDQSTCFSGSWHFESLPELSSAKVSCLCPMTGKCRSTKAWYLCLVLGQLRSPPPPSSTVPPEDQMRSLFQICPILILHAGTSNGPRTHTLRGHPGAVRVWKAKWEPRKLLFSSPSQKNN